MRLIRTLRTRKGKPLALSSLEPKIAALCRQFHIELLYLFGSYASGKTGPLSDIDIAYRAQRTINPIRLLSALQDIFSEEAIDLVDLRTAPPVLIHQILKKGTCLYARDIKTRIAFETGTECIYYDTAPLRKTYTTQLMERIEHGAFGA